MYLGIGPSHNIPILRRSVILSNTLQIGTALNNAIPWYIPRINDPHHKVRSNLNWCQRTSTSEFPRCMFSDEEGDIDHWYTRPGARTSYAEKYPV